MERWEGYNPNLSTADPNGSTVYQRDPKTGEILYQRDAGGNLVLDNKNKPVPLLKKNEPYELNERQKERVADNQRLVQEIRSGNMSQVDTLADRIASGHAGPKHVQGRNTLLLDGRISGDAKTDIPGNADNTYGQPLPITNKAELKSHIKDTLTDPATVGYTKKDGTIIVFNQKTNTMVIINPTNPDGGTAYRADDGVKNFLRCLNKDAKSGALNGSAADALHNGGLSGIVNPARTPGTASSSHTTPEQRLSDLGLTVTRPDGKPLNKPLTSPTPEPQHVSPHTAPHGAAHAPHMPRAAGGAMAVLFIAAGAAEAAEKEGRRAGMSDYAQAAWSQTVGEPLSKGRYAEVVARILEKGDVSGGLLSSRVRQSCREIGIDVDPGISNMLTQLSPEARREISQSAKQIAYLQREQFFQLQGAGIYDGKDPQGKYADVTKILRDPNQREVFMDNLRKSYSEMQNPAEKEKLKRMIEGCESFSETEEKRKALLARVETLVKPTEPGQTAATPAAASTPAPTKPVTAPVV